MLLVSNEQLKLHRPTGYVRWRKQFVNIPSIGLRLTRVMGPCPGCFSSRHTMLNWRWGTTSIPDSCNCIGLTCWDYWQMMNSFFSLGVLLWKYAYDKFKLLSTAVYTEVQDSGFWWLTENSSQMVLWLLYAFGKRLTELEHCAVIFFAVWTYIIIYLCAFSVC